MTIREYREGDWEKITDAVEPFVPPTATSSFLQGIHRGISVSGEEGGEVVACGGIIYNNTEGTVWLKIDKRCRGLGWVRTIREVFALMKKSVGDLNITTHVLKGFCRGDKMAKMIGLKATDDSVSYNGNKYTKYVTVI